jgi:UDP-N-acetylmuramoyl-tripeptide--D-alanyl-D-alanine ligase
MIAMTLQQIADVVGGTAHGDATVTGAAFVDTRAAEQAGLFVAIAGERADGHDFAEAAVAAGAAAVLGSRVTPAPTVVVDDVVLALGRLARHVLERIEGVTVYALTGSQGKTGTKDYLASILESHGAVVATAGNFNNEIGVPLTVLRAQADTRHLVVEMGARGIGHIAYLCEIAPPDVAAVLNVGTAHVGEFGSQQAIAQAKGEIVEALGADGFAVLNADDPLVEAMSTRTGARVLTFGAFDPESDASPATLAWHTMRTDALGRPSAMFQFSDDSARVTTGARVQLREVGTHQLTNAAAAMTMALAAGVSFEAVTAAIAQATARSRWRMELHERRDGLLVINDAYNANPASMRAALDALVSVGRGRTGRTVAVLGEMRELGLESADEHRALGAYAARLGVDVLVSVGIEGDPIAEGAVGHDTFVQRSGSRDEAASWVRHNVAADDVVLVKASRGVALEHVADALLVPDTRADSDTGGDEA